MSEVSGNGTAMSGLGGPAGYGEIMLSRADDASLQVNVSAVFEDGFQFGATQYSASSLFVSTNGLVSFGAAVNGVQGNLAALARPFIAAFHGDVDTRLDGEGRRAGRSGWTLTRSPMSSASHGRRSGFTAAMPA
jgi:hypothetical protein